MDSKNKKIILFSDGTGNSAASRNRTNVRRLYDTLDLQKNNQVAFYDDGVGSQEFLLFKILGGAFGYGLKRNVRELYKKLCRSYNEGDKIYLFGFSRGAFTTRVLAGMIAYCGLKTDEVVSTRNQAPEYEKSQEAQARAEAMNPALDVIFWRRWLYGLLLVTTALFLGSRFYLDWTPDGSCVDSACAIDPILVFAKDALPDLLGGWFDAWRQNPIWLWTILAAFGLFTWLKAIAWHSTQAHAGAAWAVLKDKSRQEITSIAKKYGDFVGM
ncbi:MAG: DUF2235 domain-containing protein [gamma proteobacterium endosymbiont of Lamellibrachia anaximandri]|nr:DUF2235 domain-containing protein [gamma proteobacterium endosymbiont of Lamellibrachia anaximandri]MBL3535685.1 DUF2235 domain-containing protein [gamma proteobacterium endosymbiont of Lamellibrachia anaximandri]